MSSLIVAGQARPTNLHLSPELSAVEIESDLYNICERVKEVDPNLYIIDLQKGASHTWGIMESCKDGVERLVFKTNDLDGRVIQKLQRLVAVPLSERLKAHEAEEKAWKASEEDRELEELYDRAGRPMWTDLEKCGFIDRPVSYPKRGVTGGKGSKDKSWT